MDERLYSRPLDVHRISEYPEVQRMITYLYDEMKSSGLIGKSPKDKVLKHLKVVVLDLYVAIVCCLSFLLMHLESVYKCVHNCANTPPKR